MKYFNTTICIQSKSTWSMDRIVLSSAENVNHELWEQYTIHGYTQVNAQFLGEQRNFHRDLHQKGKLAHLAAHAGTSAFKFKDAFQKLCTNLMQD